MSLGRRLAHFWLVWSALLFVHEAGHTIMARRQGLAVRGVTVGVGPAIWRGEHRGAAVTLRLVPLAGYTSVEEPSPAARPDGSRWSTWASQSATLSGGVLATLSLVLVVAGLVAVRERRTRRPWRWGRIVIADAAVLSVFNFLPVPPLDGGRALLATVAAARGAPLAPDALFWFHVGGLALALVPMTLWTRWTRRIDAAALRWGAPRPPVEFDAQPMAVQGVVLRVVSVWRT